MLSEQDVSSGPHLLAAIRGAINGRIFTTVSFFLFIAFTYFYWALVWVRLSSIYSGIWLHLTHAATLWLAHRILLKKNKKT